MLRSFLVDEIFIGFRVVAPPLGLLAEFRNKIRRNGHAGRKLCPRHRHSPISGQPLENEPVATFENFWRECVNFFFKFIHPICIKFAFKVHLSDESDEAVSFLKATHIGRVLHSVEVSRSVEQSNPAGCQSHPPNTKHAIYMQMRLKCLN